MIFHVHVIFGTSNGQVTARDDEDRHPQRQCPSSQPFRSRTKGENEGDGNGDLRECGCSEAAGRRREACLSCVLSNFCAAACRPSEHSMPPVSLLLLLLAAAPLLLAPLWRYVCPSVAYKSEEPKDVG